MADLSQTLNAPLSNPITGLYPDAQPAPAPAPSAQPDQTEDVYKKLGLSQPTQRFVPIPTPNLKKEMAARQEFMKPGLQREEELTKKVGEFEGQKALAEAQGQVLEAEGMRDAYAAYAKAMKMDEFKKEREELKAGLSKPFVPTQENAQDLAQLFSLVNVVGFAFGALGKNNAQVALSAMNGMLEGHQKGRDDLYKREKDIFEENMKQLKNRWDMLLQDMEQAAQVAQADLQLGTSTAKLNTTKHGATFIGNNIDKYGLLPTLELVRRGNDAATKAYDDAMKHIQDIEMKNVEMYNTFLQKKLSGPVGYTAFLNGTIGASTGDAKQDKEIVEAGRAIVGTNNLLNKLQDKDTKTGVQLALEQIQQRIRTVTGDNANMNLTDEQINDFINGSIDPNNKNAVFIKDALFTAFQIEREVQGGRLTVQMMKQGGQALDPKAYTKEAFAGVVGTRRNDLYRKLRGMNLNEDQINSLVTGVSAEQPAYVSAQRQDSLVYSDPEKEKRYQEWKRTHPNG